MPEHPKYLPQHPNNLEHGDINYHGDINLEHGDIIRTTWINGVQSVGVVGFHSLTFILASGTLALWPLALSSSGFPCFGSSSCLALGFRRRALLRAFVPWFFPFFGFMDFVSKLFESFRLQLWFTLLIGEIRGSFPTYSCCLVAPSVDPCNQGRC